MFLSFRKNKETKCISLQISKKFKRPQFLCQNAYIKNICEVVDFLRTLEIHYKIFDNSHLKFVKQEKTKIKKNMFDGPF